MFMMNVDTHSAMISSDVSSSGCPFGTTGETARTEHGWLQHPIMARRMASHLCLAAGVMLIFVVIWIHDGHVLAVYSS